MSDQLGKRAARGAVWMAIASGVTIVTQFAQTAILGRILTPTDFGLVALFMLVLGYSQLFARTGISPAIVQKQEQTQLELSSLYWFNIGFGVSISLLIWWLTPTIAWFFDEPPLMTLLPFVSVVALIASLGIQFQAINQKELGFRLLALLEISSNILNFIASIIAVWYFAAGANAVGWGAVAGTIIRTAILLAYGWSKPNRPRLEFSWPAIRSYVHFGLFRLGAMSLNYVSSRLDQILISSLLGTQALGYYTMASNLVVQPVQKLTPILDRVTFPVLAIVQDDTERLRKGYLQMIKVLMAINAPILFGLSAVAPTLVVVWLGYEWSPVITLIPFLAVYSLCRSLGIVGGSLMMARGRADWTLYWNILVLVVSVPAIILSALSSNLVIIAITLMLLQPLLFVLHYLLFVRKLIGDCWHEYYWESIGIPIGFALLMALFIVGTRGIIPELQRVVTLGLQIVLGGIAYGSLLFLFWKQELRTMTHILVK